MSASVVSAEVVEPYASALMSIAESNGLSEEFGDQLRSLGQLLENSQELREFIGNPILKNSDKKSVIGRIMGEGTNPYLMNFLMLMVDKRRIMFLQGVCQKYLELLRDLSGAVLAEVTSATELSEEQLQTISTKVQAMTSARAVELKTKVDRDLIGGVIVKVGSQVLDASIRGQLRRISLNLA